MQLRLLKKIADAGIKTEIIASNHDIFFLPFYTESNTREWLVGDYYTKYLDSLRGLIDRGIIVQKEVMQLIEDYYLPNFKLLSYVLGDSGVSQKITLFMHSPNGIAQIENLTSYLNGIFKNLSRSDLIIAYADKTTFELAKIIDAINNSFMKLHLSNPIEWKSIMITVQSCFNRSGDGPGLMKILWNYEPEKTLGNQPEYIKYIVHGHIAQQHSAWCGVNLDTDLGKVLHSSCNRGLYRHYQAVEPVFRHLPSDQKAQEIDKYFVVIQTALEVNVTDMQKLKDSTIENTELEFNDVYVTEVDGALKSADKLKQEFMLTTHQQNLLFDDGYGAINKTQNMINDGRFRADNFSVVGVFSSKIAEQVLNNAINKLNNIKQQLETYFSVKNFLNGVKDYKTQPDTYDKSI